MLREVTSNQEKDSHRKASTALLYPSIRETGEKEVTDLEVLRLDVLDLRCRSAVESFLSSGKDLELMPTMSRTNSNHPYPNSGYLE